MGTPEISSALPHPSSLCPTPHPTCALAPYAEQSCFASSLTSQASFASLLWEWKGGAGKGLSWHWLHRALAISLLLPRPRLWAQPFHSNPGPSTAAPRLVYTAVLRFRLLFAKLPGWDSLCRVSTCVAPHPCPTSLKRLMAERVGVLRRPTKESRCCKPEGQPSDFHTRASLSCRRAGERTGAARGAPSRHSHTWTPAISRLFALTRGHSGREPALAATYALLPAVRKRARAQQPKPTSRKPKSDPASFCFRKDTFYTHRGAHCSPSTGARTQPLLYFLRKPGFSESVLRALAAPGRGEIPSSCPRGIECAGG